MVRRRLPAAFVAFLLLTPGLGRAADVLPRAERPEDVGLSTERLARLAKITRDHVEAGRLPTRIGPGARRRTGPSSAARPDAATAARRARACPA